MPCFCDAHIWSLCGRKKTQTPVRQWNHQITKASMRVEDLVIQIKNSGVITYVPLVRWSDQSIERQSVSSDEHCIEATFSNDCCRRTNHKDAYKKGGWPCRFLTSRHEWRVTFPSESLIPNTGASWFDAWDLYGMSVSARADTQENLYAISCPG